MLLYIQKFQVVCLCGMVVLLIMAILASVSYTHLDVYKRQSLSSVCVVGNALRLGTVKL